MAETSPIPASPASPPPMNMSAIIYRPVGIPFLRPPRHWRRWRAFPVPSGCGRARSKTETRAAQRENNAHMNPRPEESGQNRRVAERGALGIIGALRILPGAEDKETQQQDRHVIHEQGRDGLADPAPGPQDTGDQGPQPSAEKPERRYPGEEEPWGQGAEVQRPPGGKKGPDVELPLAAHVDEPDPGRHGHGHGREGQGDHLHQDFGETVTAAQGAGEDIR